jgi:hypothetical protein
MTIRRLLDSPDVIDVRALLPRSDPYIRKQGPSIGIMTSTIRVRMCMLLSFLRVALSPGKTGQGAANKMMVWVVVVLPIYGQIHTMT